MYTTLFLESVQPDLARVKFLELLDLYKVPKDKCVIIGSAVMALYGLRENVDLDVNVLPSVFEIIRRDRRFTKKYSAMSKQYYYESKDGHIAIHGKNWPFKEKIRDEIENALDVKGYKFYTLQRVLEWKKIVNRPKDQLDIAVIEKFMHNNPPA